ncbi:hypothetical protein EPUS_01044 [Endocarpon pusillum Z07020]|uniref:RanBD1 domain-containing protein n=1 Tax=Endocarpon pusillum (strain Z07020 / HMAS-L-300199) TaxID=1263415 RepID=U1GAQ0_ENDPU|nr:uncharacterized protein EPUS_01044 [Endocarpon pusillum Z07020]ERF69088.1 hypothetical protein EPUS_01044 [Endocarpon pusillum Z07020]
MNNQTPSKATPAQLAARKIREAKSSMARRRTPGLSPVPTGPSFSNTQPTPSSTNTQPTASFFPVNPATSAFGGNGVNGAQTTKPPQQQPFAAPSSSTFNFTAPTGTNPFAASQPFNPFSNQNSSIEFGQQAPGGVQRSSIFSQPSAPQQPSNPFGVTSNFSFGQSTGVNNSFPPTQNTSIFSKSTPAASSFTFGSTPSLSQAPPFGAAPQTSAADHDVSMDSSESPFKSPRKPTMADQTAEAKPAPPVFGGSNPFSFTPANNGSVEETDSKPSINLGNSMFRPKNTAAQQPPQTSASISSQSSQSAEQTSPDKTTQPSAPIFNFFPKSIESEKEATEKQIASASTNTLNPFAPPRSGDTEKPQETKVETPFSFGASSESSQKQNHEQPSGQKAQGAAPFNPFQSLQSSNSASVPSQPQERTSSPAPIQSSQPSGSTSLNPFQPPKVDDSPQTQSPDSLNVLQPSKLASAATSQNASQSSVFQTAKPSEAGKSADGSSQSSGRTGSLFRTLQPGAEGFSKAAPPPLKSALKKPSYTQSKVTVTPQLAEANASPPKEDTSASASTPLFEPPQLAKSPETQGNANNTRPSIGASANVPEQPDEANAKGARQASETSNLFAQSLRQASQKASQDAGIMTPPASQAGRSSASPTKPAAAPQKVDNQLPTAAASPSTSASDPIVVKIKSHGASAVPHELNNDEFADFDKSYRLHSLNSQFKKRIAELDPEKHDFEPIIRFYATQRDAIGHPIGGLYHRVKAGEKRKTEQADRDELVTNPAKRTKIDNTAATFDQQAYPPVLGFSAITSVSTAPQPATEASPEMEIERSVFMPNSISNGSITAHQAATSSNTSNVFKSMLSFSNQGSSGNSSPPRASPVSASKPAEQPTQLFGSSSFTPLNKTTSALQNDIQSNSNGTSFGSSSCPQKTSQLFQPKAAAGSILEPPKFTSAGGTDFMSAFSAQAKKNAAKMEAENKAKRKAEDFDSDEDDEAEYERKVAEEDRVKRARIESIAKAASGFTPVLSAASSTNGAGPVAEQAEESIRHDEANESDQSQGDEGSGSEASHDYGAGDDDLEEDENEDEDIEDSQEDHGEGDETDEDDDIQTAMTKSHAKAKNPFSPSSDPKSLFNRITKPAAPSEDKGTDGASTPVQANSSSTFSAPPGTGLFGSRPTTPSLDSPKPFGSSIFSNSVSTSTPTADNTWKPGSAIKFGAPTSAPAVNITPATPLAKTNGYSTQGPLSTFSAEGSASTASKAGADNINNNNNNRSPKTTTSVFGAPSFPVQSAGSAAGSPKPFSNLFGDASKKTTVNQSSAASVGFTFGGPSKLGPSPFLAPSNPSSAITSRATSPGLTDNDSAAESVCLMTLRPGEENEDILFEVRTKALEPMTEKELTAIGSKDEAGWKTRGLGPLRVLKHSETGRARIVMRAEPGANVVINSQLIHDNKYDLNPSGKESASLKMGVFMDGKYKSWVFKIKTMKIAQELVDCLKENEPAARDAESD